MDKKIKFYDSIEDREKDEVNFFKNLSPVERIKYAVENMRKIFQKDIANYPQKRILNFKK